MRSPFGPALVAACLSALPSPALAEEPLFLRIRPQATEFGRAGDDRAEAEIAARARAAREAVWERSNRRARMAIASVCTGCLKPIPPFAVAPPERPLAAAPPIRSTRSAALTPSEGDP